MRRRFLVAALTAAACSAPQNPLALTSGVRLTPPGCPYSITTPAETTAPLFDNSSLGIAADPRNIHMTFVGDPSSSTVVTWETDVGTGATLLKWGTSALDRPQRGFSFAYPVDLAGSDPPTVRIHQVHLCGLQPATTYRYRVGDGEHSSSEASFTTAPAGPASLRFVDVGDSRGNVATWGSVLAAAAGEKPDFLMFTGDAIDLGTIQEQWEAWFAVGVGILEQLPMMFAHGNHEINARHFYAQFPLPGNQQWYSFDYGNAHFTVLNDSPQDMATISGDQALFLDHDLSTNTKLWKIVVHHKPVFTSSTGHMSDVHLQQAWAPLYEKYGVDLVLNGHAHEYERSYPLLAGQTVSDGSGPVYVVEGGGGADFYGVQKEAFTAAYAAHVYGYVVIDVKDRMLSLTAKSMDGTVIDRYAISK